MARGRTTISCTAHETTFSSGAGTGILSPDRHATCIFREAAVISTGSRCCRNLTPLFADRPMTSVTVRNEERGHKTLEKRRNRWTASFESQFTSATLPPKRGGSDNWCAESSHNAPEPHIWARPESRLCVGLAIVEGLIRDSTVSVPNSDRWLTFQLLGYGTRRHGGTQADNGLRRGGSYVIREN